MERSLSRGVLLAAALLAIAALSGSPAFAAADCDTGSPAAKQLTFDANDDDTRQGLATALRFGLDPGTFPKDDIAKNARDCTRGTIRSLGASFVLLGKNSSLPERWIETPGPAGVIVYMASLPKPAAALAWQKGAKSGQTQVEFQTADMMYVLALTGGSKRYLHAFFDVMPDDATLAKAICGALTGQLPAIGTYDTDTGDSEVTRQIGAAADLSAIQGCAWTPASP